MAQGRRRHFLIATSALLAAPFVRAQKPDKVWRIGFLALRSRPTASRPDTHYDAFVAGMRDLGYVEGKNLVIEWRFADGKYERLSGLAKELVEMRVNVIVSQGTPGTRAAQRATATVPIVFPAMNDPVGSGIVASLARPGGNTTGLTDINVDLSPKQFEFLKTILPRMRRTALFVHPGNMAHPAVLNNVQKAASNVDVQVIPLSAGTPEEIERGFTSMLEHRAEAIMIPADGFYIGQAKQIAELAIKHRVPAIFTDRGNVKAGGLISYGQNLAELYRRAAIYVDKILKGTKPSDLPVEGPTILHLAINLKTAKALGLTIPRELLLRADEVIE
jgi:putative ABC transport system substrate-binding protein